MNMRAWLPNYKSINISSKEPWAYTKAASRVVASVKHILSVILLRHRLLSDVLPTEGMPLFFPLPKQDGRHETGQGLKIHMQVRP